MPERPGASPYARPVTRAGEAPNPTNEHIWAGPGRYSVPDIPATTDPEYLDGFSPTLATSGSPTGAQLPDDIRVGTREPPPNSPQDQRVYLRRFNEFFRRAQDDRVTQNWHVQQRKIPAPRVPEWEQEKLPIRPTADLAPMPYLFRRSEHRPRNIKDAIGEQAVDHVSMADHRRNYEIFGMKPQGATGVNTYRAPIRPWDENRFVPSNPSSPPAQTSPSATLFGTTRTFRMGG